MSPEAKDPEDAGPSEKFFRDIYTYLDDCYKKKMDRGLPQLLLMLDSRGGFFGLFVGSGLVDEGGDLQYGSSDWTMV